MRYGVTNNAITLELNNILMKQITMKLMKLSF